MNNQQIRECRIAATLSENELKTIHAQENRAFDAGYCGREFPKDLNFRGRNASAYWAGIAERENEGIAQ